MPTVETVAAEVVIKQLTAWATAAHSRGVKWGKELGT